MQSHAKVPLFKDFGGRQSFLLSHEIEISLLKACPVNVKQGALRTSILGRLELSPTNNASNAELTHGRKDQGRMKEANYRKQQPGCTNYPSVHATPPKDYILPPLRAL